jgi:hypothetical protein
MNGNSIIRHGVPIQQHQLIATIRGDFRSNGLLPSILQQHQLIDAEEGEFWLSHGRPIIQGLSGKFTPSILQMYWSCNRHTPYFTITKWLDGRIRYDGQVPEALKALIGEASQNVPTLHVEVNAHTTLNQLPESQDDHNETNSSDVEQIHQDNDNEASSSDVEQVVELFDEMTTE